MSPPPTKKMRFCEPEPNEKIFGVMSSILNVKSCNFNENVEPKPAIVFFEPGIYLTLVEESFAKDFLEISIKNGYKSTFAQISPLMNPKNPSFNYMMYAKVVPNIPTYLLENEHETLLSVVSTFKPDILFGLNDFELLRKILSFELNSFSGQKFGNLWFTTEFSTQMGTEQTNSDQKALGPSTSQFALKPSTSHPTLEPSQDEQDLSSTSSQVSSISIYDED